MKKLFAILFFSIISINAFAIEYSSTISINVTDKDATTAKQKAWSHANRVALNNVMKKISNNVSLDYLSDEQILNLVKQTEVLSEKNSQTTYIGKLKIVFNKSVLDNFLKEKNIQKINISASKALIIPIYKDPLEKKTLLWEENNKLKKAFENLSTNSIVKLETIKETPNNYSLASIETLNSLDKNILSKLANSNFVEDVFIINAQPFDNHSLLASISHYKDGKTNTHSITIQKDKEANSNDIFAMAAIEITNNITQKIKEASFNTKTSQNSINAIFNFSNLHQYLWIKNDLEKSSIIKSITPIAMQSGRIEVKINYKSNYQQFLYTIKNKGLTLRQEMGYNILERI